MIKLRALSLFTLLQFTVLIYKLLIEERLYNLLSKTVRNAMGNESAAYTARTLIFLVNISFILGHF